MKSLLQLEKLRENVYRANYVEPRIPATYGGQLLAQAISAAGDTVSSTQQLHSIQSQFLRPGNPGLPITYHIEHLRSGDVFSQRLVKATQDDRIIFTAMTSFHQNEVAMVTHQQPMPTDVPPPENLNTLKEEMRRALRDEIENMSELRRSMLQTHLLFNTAVELEMKMTDAANQHPAFISKPSSSKLLIYWMKAKENIEKVDQHFNRSVAAYLSDSGPMSLVSAAIDLRKYPSTAPGITLNHSIWFHSDINANQWLLVDCKLLRMNGNRGLVISQIWRRDGVLAATCMQEGLCRAKSAL